MKKIILIASILFTSIGYSQNFWQPANGPANENIRALAVDSSGHIFAGTNNSGIFRSTDNGGNWTSINNGLTSSQVLAVIFPSAGYAFAGTYAGIFRSSDNGNNWLQVAIPSISFTCFVINSRGTILAGTYIDGIYSSTDNGSGWAQSSSGLTEIQIRSLAMNSLGYIFAGTYGGGMFCSTNFGYGWLPQNNGLSNNHVWSVKVNSSGYIFAGTDDGVFRSTNNGGNWVQVNSGLTTKSINTLLISPNGNIFAGTEGGGVFVSSDNGYNWNPLNAGLTNLAVKALAINSEGYIFAGTNGNGVFRSVSFATPVELSSFVAKIEYKNTYLSWTTATELNNRGFEIERKTAEGKFNSIAFINGFGTSTETKSYSFIDKNLPNDKYQYRLKQVDFDGKSKLSKTIEVEINNLEYYNLDQNFPNPFNLSTTFNYSLPKEGNIKLTIYNSIGSKIETLIDEMKLAGDYSLQFNGGNLPSGIYFYKLEADRFSQIKKMILNK